MRAVAARLVRPLVKCREGAKISQVLSKTRSRRGLINQPPRAVEARTCSLRVKVVTAVIWANSLVGAPPTVRTRPGMSA